MLFKYKAINVNGNQMEGEVDAIDKELAITELQRRGLAITGIKPAEGSNFSLKFQSLFARVKNKDIVIVSRQMATLFEAQVSALRVFTLLGAQIDNPTLKSFFLEIVDDLQGGSSISAALSKHPKAFSDFYVNMVKAGEESGKLDETFAYLADYLDRSYEVSSKAKNALTYPAFIVLTFIGVMVLMFTSIIPKIAVMIEESGQEIPFYTKIVLGISGFLVDYGIFLGVGVVIGGFLLWRYSRTETGAAAFDKFRLDIPYLGSLYRKLYLSRIADNLNTMILSGIPILRALEITSAVVDNKVFKDIIDQTLSEVKSGSSISASFGKHEEIPGIMVQMIKVGEETGSLGNLLKTLAKFYQREMTGAIDTMVGLIEPVMIVALGLGVGFLLASVLMPIYNIASAT